MIAKDCAGDLPYPYRTLGRTNPAHVFLILAIQQVEY
jgi:hypothetical protein